MPGRIPQSFIDDLLDRTDIVDVINSRVPLKKAGKSYKACCPFHEEKTPSFTVAQDKQFYHCFGCKAGGNALGFLMDYERLDFPQAVEILARNAGMEIPREVTEDSAATRERENLHSILLEADRFYRSQLRQHPLASSAVDYLKRRGLSGEICARFGVGYAPAGWDNLLLALGSTNERKQLLEQAGLLISRPEEKKIYDRFRQRIMFPIRDQRGRCIGFGGRVLDRSEPKYLNSPETPVFHKGRELYGLYEARQALKEIPWLLVVEGYMDVISLAQFDIPNAVATLGTALTDDHLQRLFRYTSEVIFCFDGDMAGRKAAERALETCLPHLGDGRSARFLFLPEGEDPDSMVRKSGAEKFRKRASAARPLSEFLFDQASEGIDLKTREGKARLKERCAPQIGRIPEGVFRQLMLEELARRAEIRVENLYGYLQREAEPPPPTSVPDLDYPERTPAWEREPVAGLNTLQRSVTTPEQKLISLLLVNPSLAELAEDIELLERAGSPLLSLFLRVLQLVRTNPHYKPSHIIAYWQGMHGHREETQLMQTLAANEIYRPPPGVGRDDATEFRDTLASVRHNAFEQLPLPSCEKVRMLLAREHLSEREIKYLTRLQLQLEDNAQSVDLKKAIKQRLVV